MKTKQRGAIDPISISIAVICFAVGGYYYFFSKDVDAPAEQIAENVLDKQGVVIDFSKHKKDKQ